MKPLEGYCEFLVLDPDWGKASSVYLFPSPSIFPAHSFIQQNECFEYLLCARPYSKPCYVINKSYKTPAVRSLHSDVLLERQN